MIGGFGVGWVVECEDLVVVDDFCVVWGCVGELGN